MERETGNEMIQSAVRLPRSLHERLKKAGGERGMGEEIRRRLEASFEAEAPSDPKTRELLEAISYVAAQTTHFFGSWSVNAFAFQSLKASVDRLLKQYRPKGDPALAIPNPTAAGEIIFGPTGPLGPTGPTGAATGPTGPTGAATGPTGPTGAATGPTGPTGPAENENLSPEEISRTIVGMWLSTRPK
jgi:hypothetical protein